MKITFNPSTVAALTTPPNNKDITFDLRGRNIFARGVKFYGTDTNTWRDIKINNVSIGSHTLDLRNGSNTTLTNTNGVVTINSTWRPVVDNLTSDSTTSSLSAKQGKVLKSLIDGKSNSGHTHDDRYLKLTGGTMASNALITFADSGSGGTNKGPQGARGGLYWTGRSDYTKLYAEETARDNLDLVIQFGDDNSNGLSIRNKANTQTSYISASGVITTGTFKGNLDWSYITNKPATATRWPSWAEVTGKPSSFTPSAHTHSWTSITDKLVVNEFNIVNDGYNDELWFNYLPINDRSKTASIHTYIMCNGAKGMASVTASGFIKNGSSSSYVLLGDGGHKAISDFAPSSHSHNYAANENYGGFTKSGRLPISGFYQSNESESGGNAPQLGWMHLINCQHSNTGNNYALQIAASFYNNNTFKIRVTNNNVNNAWRDIIHSGNIDSQTVANAYHLRINSANTWSNWYWSEQSDQPSWLWGSNDGTNMYVWNPSNFRVAYASSAGNADTVDGEHAKNFVRAGCYEYNNNNLNSLDTYSFIRSVKSQVSSTSPKGNIGWYNVIQLAHRNGDWDGPDYIGQIALGMTTNENDIFFRCKRTDPWKTIIHSNNYTEFINNYYWANVKISASSSTTTSPTVHTLTATRVCAGHNPEIDNSISCSNWFRSSGNTGWYNTTYQGGWYMSDTSWIRAHNGVGIYTSGQIYSSSSIRMSNILLEHTDEINNSADGYIYLNYRNSGNVSLCYGGGNVGIGTATPSYKLDVNGQMKASGFHHSSVNSNDYMLLAGGGYKSFGGDDSTPIFLGCLDLYHGNDGTIIDFFYCLGYSVPFTYTRGGNYCKIVIPDTTRLSFYIIAATASVNYSGGGMDAWVGTHRGEGAWWLHCQAFGQNEVRVKGFRLANDHNDSWWGGNPLYSGNGGANKITVCIFGHVRYK